MDLYTHFLCLFLSFHIIFPSQFLFIQYLARACSRATICKAKGFDFWSKSRTHFTQSKEVSRKKCFWHHWSLSLAFQHVGWQAHLSLAGALGFTISVFGFCTRLYHVYHIPTYNIHSRFHIFIHNKSNHFIIMIKMSIRVTLAFHCFTLIRACIDELKWLTDLSSISNII